MTHEFKATGSFVVRGRGTCFGVKNPGGLPEPNVLTGQEVLIDGQPFKVQGVETFAIARPYPESFDFALLVDTPEPGPDDPSFTCPICDSVTHGRDVEEGYCPSCRAFTRHCTVGGCLLEPVAVAGNIGICRPHGLELGVVR